MVDVKRSTIKEGYGAMMAVFLSAVAFSVLFLSSCASKGGTVGGNGAGAAMSIGTATMLPDGTVVLDLRAGGLAGTPVGDGRLTYPPNHPQYREILEHLGGIRPGETRPVPPWTDD